ncbi:MAG: site-specific integrase [archaeon]|nr:site-specific integrase [archaeon]
MANISQGDNSTQKIQINEIEAYNQVIIGRYLQTDNIRGLSKGRKKKLRETLGKLGRVHLNKRLDLVTTEDLEEFIEALEQDELDDPEYPEGYEDSTKVTYRKILKPFFNWLHSAEVKDWAGWIRTGNYESTVGPGDILDEAELNMMRAACKTPRDKAMLETLYESALRPKEFLSLRRTDIEFQKDCVWIHIRKGKTKHPRDIILVGNARALLTQWVLNEHPNRNDSDFALWVDMSSNALSHAPLTDLRKWIRRIAETVRNNSNGSFSKKVKPYTMRHTRLTDLARLGANEALLTQIAGWKDLTVASIYIHLSGRDQKPALLRLLGVPQEEQTKPVILMPKKCYLCKEPSPSDAKVCWKCNSPLDPETAMQLLQKKMEIERELEEFRAFRRNTQEFMKKWLDLSSEEVADGIAREYRRKMKREERIRAQMERTTIQEDLKGEEIPTSTPEEVQAFKERLKKAKKL